MQQTTNYNLLIPEGTDIVNPLTQVNPNFQTIDSAMFANKQATIGTASEVVTGTVHAIIRNNADSDVFRFTATGAWTAGDTMTLDGQQVTVHLSDGTTPATNSYIIGAEVLAMVNGSLVTLAISTTPPAQGVTSFNTRTGAVMPAASDYNASQVDYDNTNSGLNATDVQGAIDELASTPSSAGSCDLIWSNPDDAVDFTARALTLDFSNYDVILIRAKGYKSVLNYTVSTLVKGLACEITAYSFVGSNVLQICRRTVTVSNNSITFTEGAAYSSGTSGVSTDAVCIPSEIYGIKF